jgi:hypothetical protein
MKRILLVAAMALVCALAFGQNRDGYVPDSVANFWLSHSSDYCSYVDTVFVPGETGMAGEWLWIVYGGELNGKVYTQDGQYPVLIVQVEYRADGRVVTFFDNTGNVTENNAESWTGRILDTGVPRDCNIQLIKYRPNK